MVFTWCGRDVWHVSSFHVQTGWGSNSGIVRRVYCGGHCLRIREGYQGHPPAYWKSHCLYLCVDSGTDQSGRAESMATMKVRADGLPATLVGSVGDVVGVTDVLA